MPCRPFAAGEATAGGGGVNAGLGRFAPPPRRITKALLVGGAASCSTMRLGAHGRLCGKAADRV